MHAAGLDESDATGAQRSDRREHVGRTDANALQRFVALDVEDGRFRLDQLQVEAPARAAQDATLGQDAEALLVG